MLLKTFRIALIVSFVLIVHQLTIAQTSNYCTSNASIHVVVIGSSTAAGSGPSSPDSAWVNRYRRHLTSLNPNNLVTNLAIGGTTTYHIMPSWFVAPAGRPATNVNNNVSRAIFLNADAIIVNMPSNDAGNGFGVMEQMQNFRTIAASADSAGIPVWICTTQPRNFFNATQIAIQLDVRDSILAYFGNYAIDFWSGFSNASNGLSATFNSGDGVHMNDTAHGILNQRVIAANIPLALVDTLAFTDHVIYDFSTTPVSECGDSNSIVRAVVANIGKGSTMPTSVTFSVKDLTTLTSYDTTFNLTMGLGACSADTVALIINTYDKSHLSLSAYNTNSDSIKLNDSSKSITIRSLGHPFLIPNNDTICSGDSAVLSAGYNGNSDSLLWYDAAIGGKLMHIGEQFATGPLDSNFTMFIKAVRGGLRNDKSLFTSSTTSTNWNGMMFNITALDTITLDSIAVKVNTPGIQHINAYHRSGSYVGYENNATAWQYWGLDSTAVSNPGEYADLNFSDVNMLPGDTLGVYLYMQVPASNISYLPSPSPIIYSNSEVEINSGSGIAYNFGTVYYPRNFSGRIYYRHGFNPDGKCSTDRIPVSAVIAQPLINLGKDTVIKAEDSLILRPKSGFQHYLWSDSTTSSTLQVDSIKFKIDTNLIWLEVTDKFGCMSRDTILVKIEKPTGHFNLISAQIKTFPNPFTDQLTIELGIISDKVKLRIVDLRGVIMKEKLYSSTSQLILETNELPAGIYLLEVEVDQGLYRKRILRVN